MAITSVADTFIAGDPIVKEARKRWERAAEWESNWRIRFIDDIKFANGDADNGYQWPNELRRGRNGVAKPCLTINVLQQHNLQIVNQSKMNKQEIKIKGVGNGATNESANCFESVIRKICRSSASQDSFGLAQAFQVEGGIGAWRIITEYDGPETFDQVVKIAPIKDPLNVYFDPDAVWKDKRDSNFGFIFDTIPKDEWEDAYPKYKNFAGLNPMGVVASTDDWMSGEYVRICEYFRKVQKKDRLVSFWEENSRTRITLRESLMPENVARSILKDKLTKTRDVWDDVVEWYLIVGEEIADQTEWPGRYIPIVPCLGIETLIEGQLDRKGHTRAMKDAQRMYNYAASAQIEGISIQGKTPWIAPAKAIEEVEQYWRTANTANHSVLVWNHLDDEGNPVPPPFRAEPPKSSEGYQTAMETAFNQMMMSSGQWQNQMGMMGNERTGEAISQRQEQGDVATFHFQDNYASALRFTGEILLDIIPRVYDTKRVVQIMADDGIEYDVTIDPAAQQAYQKQLSQDGFVANRIFNPNVGRYEVEADVGQAIGTKREKTANALTLILTQAPTLTGVIGDLLLDSLDFDKAHEAAVRLRRMVPPQALGQGPTQNEMQLQQQLQATQAALSKALEQTGKDRLKLVGKDQMREIDMYKAETDRFEALADALMLDQGGVKQVIEQLVHQTLKGAGLVKYGIDGLDGGLGQNGGGSNGSNGASSATPAPETPPVPGAAKAPDGEWYLADPTRKGKYLRVGPLAQERSQRSVISNA